MLKAMNSFATKRAVAAVALAIAISAPVSAETMMDESYWYASGDPTVPDGQLWTNSYGECWQSEYPDGPTNLPPCAAAPVPEEVSVTINFEFDKYQVPETVVNREAIAEIDDYIEKVKATPEQEYVTVVGHTDAKGSDEYNMALGMRRAEAVRDYIIAQGYPAQNMGPPVSEGKRDLLPDVDPYSVLQRRVVLTKTEL
jgi:OOP family OmpA-OmpF porin